MTFRIEHGKPSTQIGFAQEAGKAKARERASAQALAFAERKMALDYQQALKQQDAAIDLEMQRRAKMWEIEKMETNSRLEQEIENRRYIRNTERYQAGLNEIDKVRAEGNHPESVIQMMQYTLDKEFANKIPEAAARLGQTYLEVERQRAEARGKKGLFDFGRTPPATSVAGTMSNPLGLNITSTPTTELPKRIREMEAQNKFRVISPNGKEEIIDATKWPEYKKKGYLLAELVRLKKRRPWIEAASRQWRGFNY